MNAAYAAGLVGRERRCARSSTRTILTNSLGKSDTNRAAVGGILVFGETLAGASAKRFGEVRKNGREGGSRRDLGRERIVR